MNIKKLIEDFKDVEEVAPIPEDVTNYIKNDVDHLIEVIFEEYPETTLRNILRESLMTMFRMGRIHGYK